MYTIPTLSRTAMHYTYNSNTTDSIPDGLLTGVTMFDGGSISYSYDYLQRISNRNIAGKLEERYAYAAGSGENTTTTRVSTKRNFWNGSLINQFQHGYDAVGNITNVYDAASGKRVNYTYDDQNQLLKAVHIDNGTVTRTEVYTYDNVGNILTFNNGTTSHTYTYGDENWKDLLTAVDGNPITYDASGNPTSYYNGYTMTWVEGRKLDTVTVNGQTYTYVYNSDGQRVKKIHPDGSYIEYYVMDGTTVGESHFTATGNKTLGIRYTLDESGTVVGFTMNGVNYYFAKNLQGDVLAVYNATTNKLAAQYTYDSWGNILTATGTLAETNPFRYRGYYYDKETNFYYLQSRYYDAAIGRFVNADVYASTGQGIIGCNMFAYCINNPISYLDSSGLEAMYFSEDTIYLLSEALAALIASASSALASMQTALSSVVIPILCIAALAITVISVIYLIEQVSHLYQMAEEVIAGVEAQILAKRLTTNELREYTVYVIAYKNTTRVCYVGMTKNYSAREYSHQRAPGARYKVDKYDMIPVATGLSYKEARALEQALITAYTLEGLNNIINSIAKKNLRKFEKEMERMRSLISSYYDPE